jgi:hypothetical protein
MRTYCAARIGSRGTESAEVGTGKFTTHAAFVDLKRIGLNSHQSYWGCERMSFTKKDRKVQTKTGKAFSSSIKDEPLAIARAGYRDSDERPRSRKDVVRSPLEFGVITSSLMPRTQPPCSNPPIRFAGCLQLKRTDKTASSRTFLQLLAGISKFARVWSSSVRPIKDSERTRGYPSFTPFIAAALLTNFMTCSPPAS